MNTYIKKYYYNYDRLVKKYNKLLCDYKLCKLFKFVLFIWEQYPQLYYYYINKTNINVYYIFLETNTIYYSINCSIDIQYQHDSFLDNKYLLRIRYFNIANGLTLYKSTIGLLLFALEHIITI